MTLVEPPHDTVAMIMSMNGLDCELEVIMSMSTPHPNVESM